MTYAGVLMAFSVPLTPRMLDANADLPEAGRAIVVPVPDPRAVRTHALHGEGAYLLAGRNDGSFPSGTRDASLARALAYVAPQEGVYDPPELTFAGVASRNGTSELTVDVAALAQGASGWIVMGSNEEEPRFFARDEVVGEVVRFVSSSGLGTLFASAFVGFVAPLVFLVATHRPAGRAGAPIAMCRECRASMSPSAEFCLRCGAYRGE